MNFVLFCFVLCSPTPWIPGVLWIKVNEHWGLPSLKLETQQTNEIWGWSWLQVPHFPCIDWVIKSSHMVVFCRSCSRFSSMFLCGNLFSGWLKIYPYLQLSVICSGQKWLAQWEGLPSASPCYWLWVSHWKQKQKQKHSLFLLSSASQNTRSVETIGLLHWGTAEVLVQTVYP